MRVNQALRRLKRVKIGVGNTDVPRNEAVRSDVDLVLGHDERAVDEREIADRAAPIFADGKGASGIKGHMLPDYDFARLFAAKMAKDLRALTIEAFTELDVWRNRLRPPITFHMSILFNVAHVG